MNYKTTRRIGCGGVILLYLLALVFIVTACFMCSCSRTTYVPVETVKTQYQDHEVERVVTDTVHDNNFVYIKGDSVIVYRDRVRIKYVAVHDTTTVIRTDSVAVPYPVERELTSWQKAKMNFGEVCITLTVLLVIVAIIWLIKKYRK
jgi:hypothetical protein